jgi:hypothetical protein
MVNWTVTPYLTFAAAQTAQEAIANDVYSQIIPFMESGLQKFAVISPGVKLPVDVGVLSVSVSGSTFTSDIEKVAGTATAVNAGNNSAGTQRMCIATDDVNLAAIKTSTDKIPAQGQALAAGSIPVVLPAAQMTTLTPIPAITNYAEETGGNLASVKTNTDKIPAQGQALAASSIPVVLPALQAADLKSVTIKDNPLADSKLRVSSMPYGYDIVEGNITGHTPFFKTGYNADVDAAEEDMWVVGGMYVFPAASQRMEVVSSSTADAAAGTGALTIKIWYLTNTFVEKTEVVTLTGVTPVPTVATDIYRINAFRVLTAGTGGSAAGTIDIRHITLGTIYSRIAIGNTRARNSIYTVPVDKTLYISQLSCSVGNSAGGRYARFTLRATYDDQAQATSGLLYPYYEIGIQDSAYNMHLDFPIKFPTGTDIKMSVIGDATSADAICTCTYRGWLEAV